ncbi:hypothetical protein [uncultured Imperialibacter sp.]|uniref:hypothetical protein n=1 Tax=uncultured Imperialibacter sp. TaxID=1672639 RepID=UPI0030DDC6B9|tara:strand:- start:828 stop:1352 length:525 start_codon:yes stop_codon:yes gene_type:complete
MKMIDIYLEKVITQAENMIWDGDHFEGKDMLENVLTYEPGYAKVHNLLGWLHLYYIEDDELAEKHLKLAVKFEPNWKVPYIHLTTLYMRNENFDKLGEVMMKAREIEGISKALVFERLAMVEEAKRRYTAAIRLYKTAIFHSMDNDAIEEMRSNIKRCRFKRLRFVRQKWQRQK